MLLLLSLNLIHCIRLLLYLLLVLLKLGDSEKGFFYEFIILYFFKYLSFETAQGLFNSCFVGYYLGILSMLNIDELILLNFMIFCAWCLISCIF